MKELKLYKTIGDWCNDFKKENGRKATFDDFFSRENRLKNEYRRKNEN